MPFDATHLLPSARAGAALQSLEVERTFSAMPSTAPATSSFSVSDPPRTAMSWCLSGDEVKRLLGSTLLMKQKARRGRCGCAMVTVGDAVFDMTEREARDAIRDLEARITRDQERAHLPKYRVTVYESVGGFHAHIVCMATPQLIERWRASAEFTPFCVGEDAIQQVTDPHRLAQRYLTKERRPAPPGTQRHLGARVPGSHRIEGGGDRVRLSAQLKADALAKDLITPWKRTKAKTPKPPSTERTSAAIESPKVLRETLFDLPGLPAKAAQAVRPKRARPPIATKHEGQGELPLAMPDIADLIRTIPGSDAERATLIGVSRAQVTNIRNRQFGPSRHVARRIVEIAMAA
jgi:hypothetical protein